MADVEVGGTPSTAVPAFWGGGIPWMSSGDVHFRRIVDVPGRITEVGLQSSNAKLIEPPAVAIGLAGQGKTRGTAALTLVRLCTNQSVALVRGHRGLLDSTYLFHNLDRRYEELRARSAGGGRAGLSKAILEALPIPLPPEAEQRRIAEVLDTTDRAIEQTGAVIAKLKQMRAGLLHDLLTRGLDEKGRLRDPVAHPEQFVPSPIGAIPRTWGTAGLLEVVPRAEYGISVPLEDRTGTPVLRMNNLQNGEIRLDDLKYSSAREASSLLLRPLDVLFNRTNSFDHVGRTAIWRGQLEVASFASYLVRLDPDRSRLEPEYLNLWLNLPEVQIAMRRYATPGVHQVNINPTNLRKLTIALPQYLDEQRAIIQQVAAHDQRIRAEIAYWEKLKLIKRGLMEDLLTGRVRVTG